MPIDNVLPQHDNGRLHTSIRTRNIITWWFSDKIDNKAIFDQKSKLNHVKWLPNDNGDRHFDCTPKISIFTNPSSQTGYDTRSIFNRSLTGLNSEFSFSYTSCLTKAEELSLSYYLPIAGRRIIGFIPFPRVLVLCEMQLAWSRIWIRFAVSISYDDNHYTTGTSKYT